MLLNVFLIEDFNNNFFNKPKEEVVNKFARRIRTYLGEEAFNRIGTKHIEDLYDLGYLPIEIKALPEGTVCPIRVPALTVINTKPKFFWLTNYFETLLSNTLWLPMTSATTARLYKKELIRHATLTGYVDDPNIILGFNCHDFDYLLKDGIVCYPDRGAKERYFSSENKDAIVLNKKRDLENKGKILSIDIESFPDIPNKSIKRIIISDDLCDAGGTLCWAAKILKEKYPNAQLDIFVCHMVNPVGIKNLSENFDNVFFTNSYRDWDNLPENCYLIKLI